MIRIHFSAEDVLNNIDELTRDLFSDEGILLAFLQKIGNEIAENVGHRLLTTDTARSSWRTDLVTPLRYNKDGTPVTGREDYESDPNKSEQLKSFIRAEVSKDKADGSIFVGVGRIKDLEKVQLAGDDVGGKFSLWAILEFGYGQFSTHPDVVPRMIRRAGGKNQVFPFRSEWGTKRVGEAMSFEYTDNPGQLGRHYFMTVLGVLYAEDMRLMDSVHSLIRNRLHKFSYAR